MCIRDSVDIDDRTGTIKIDEKILFEVDQYYLKDEGKEYLRRVIPLYLKIFIENEKFKSRLDQIIIEGHSDDMGSYIYNMDLSQKRATEVLKYIYTTCLLYTSIQGIILLFSIFRNKKKKEEANEELEDAVRGAISEVANGITPQVTKIVEDAKEKLFNTLNEKCKNEQEEIDKILKELIEKKKEEEEEFQKSVTDLENDIAKLKSLEL